jgi:hypothetical protein
MDELPSMDELPLKIVKMHGAENVGKPDSWFAISSWFQSHGTGRQMASASSLLTLAENSGTTVSPATKVNVFGPWRIN